MITNQHQRNMPTIDFKTKLFKIGSWTVLRLDKSVSAKLSSRGLTMVEGTINGFHFQTALEPDGRGSHWFRVDKSIQEAISGKAGDSVNLAIKQTSQWPEPEVPVDLKNTLSASPKAKTTWMDITPLARWEWLRWIGSTKNPETRARRIEVARSKLNSGDRRPCCFNSNQCTVPYVSNNGVLLEPMQVPQP